MLPSHYLTLPSTLTVTSPLVHSDERVEVMQRFRREPFLVDGEILDIPVLSGNAIRGMLRRAGALRLCESLAVKPRELPLRTFHLLFSGGYLEGSEYAWRIEQVQALRDAVPLLALLGGSWGPRVLPGCLDIWRGEPVCAELAAQPGHVGDAAYKDGAPSVFDLLCEVSYTRRDDRADEAGEDRSPVQMRFSYEALIPGTVLLHGAVVRATDPLLIGCFADCAAICTEWQRLGGRAAIGHGRFRWGWDALRDTHADARAAYLAHVVDDADAARELLELPRAAA